MTELSKNKINDILSVLDMIIESLPKEDKSFLTGTYSSTYFS